MAKTYLHDIPMDLFLKYFSNYKNTNKYSPVGVDARCNKYYNIILKTNSDNITINYSLLPCDVYTKYENISNDDYIDTLNSIFNLNIPKSTLITSTEQKIITSDTKLYLNPFQDNDLFGPFSLFGYVAIINNIVYPHIYLSEDGNTYCFGEAYKDNICTNKQNISSAQKIDPIYNLNYNTIYSDNTETKKEIGRLYHLETLKIIDHNADGYLFTIDNENKRLTTLENQSTTLETYFNYMKSIKTGKKSKLDTTYFTLADLGLGKVIYKKIYDRDIIGYEVSVDHNAYKPEQNETTNTGFLIKSYKTRELNSYNTTYNNTLLNLSNDKSKHVFVNSENSKNNKTYKRILFDSKYLYKKPLIENILYNKYYFYYFYNVKYLKNYCFFNINNELYYIDTGINIQTGERYTPTFKSMKFVDYLKDKFNENTTLNISLIPYADYKPTVSSNCYVTNTIENYTESVTLQPDSDSVKKINISECKSLDDIKNAFINANLFIDDSLTDNDKYIQTDLSKEYMDSFKNILHTNFLNSTNSLNMSDISSIYLKIKGYNDLLTSFIANDSIIANKVKYYDIDKDEYVTDYINPNSVNITSLYTFNEGSKQDNKNNTSISDTSVAMNVLNESYIDKLLNYKKYNSNIDEVKYLINDKNHKTMSDKFSYVNEQQVSTEKIQPATLRKDVKSKYDIDDIKNKFLTFYTSFVYDCEKCYTSSQMDGNIELYNEYYKKYYKDKIERNDNIFMIPEAENVNYIKYYFTSDHEMSKKMFIQAMKDKYSKLED